MDRYVTRVDDGVRPGTFNVLIAERLLPGDNAPMYVCFATLVCASEEHLARVHDMAALANEAAGGAPSVRPARIDDHGLPEGTWRERPPLL